MEAIPTSLVLTLLGIVISAIATFLATRHSLENKIRDKYDELSKEITRLDKEMIHLKHKDDLQQQVIDEFRKQMIDYIPKLMMLVAEKEKSK